MDDHYQSPTANISQLVSSLEVLECDQYHALNERYQNYQNHYHPPPWLTAEIKLYGHQNFRPYLDTGNFIRRRNERERARVRNVNEGFERLRDALPLTSTQRDKRLSKVETLRLAINYIRHLQAILNEDND